jgi:hypothetical protein
MVSLEVAGSGHRDDGSGVRSLGHGGWMSHPFLSHTCNLPQPNPSKPGAAAQTSTGTPRCVLPLPSTHLLLCLL